MNEATLNTPVRVAIVGCGAVSEKLHFPVLSKMKQVTVSALVDSDRARLNALASPFGDVHVATSIEGLEKHADAAILAVPHHLHAPIGIRLLEMGLHLFVEKPLATTSGEAKRLIEAARRHNRVLCVGQIRRHYETFSYVQRVLTAGWLGRIESFDFREGAVYGWPAVSDALFQKEKGGGVLLDTGAHTLDMLVTWLGGFETLKYTDDSRGGVEANCQLDIRLKCGAEGVVELSRTRFLRNSCIIRGERGELEVGVGPKGPVSLRVGGMRLNGLPTDGFYPGGDFINIARKQMESFIHAVKTGAEPAVSGESVLESIRIFDECRLNRQRMSFVWEPFEGVVDWSQLSGKRVLVLGASGFLGGRLVEALAQRSDAKVRVLIRDYSRLSNVARFPVEIIHGDIADSATLNRALKDSDYVINCTYGKGDRKEQFRVNVEAVRKLVRLASEYDIQKIVHTSTVSVYGNVKKGVIHEELRANAPKKDAYGYTKMLGEQIALREGKSLNVPVVVIQPTVIYGPDAPSWTVNPLRMLKSGRMVLVEKGEGVCNAVYVDDVVTALLQAAVTKDVFGERLLISGPEAITWRDFYGAYEEIVGPGAIAILESEEIAREKARQRRNFSTWAQLKRLLQEEYGGHPRFIELPPIAFLRSAVRSFVPRKAIERMKQRVIKEASIRSPREERESRALYLPTKEQEEFFGARAVVNCDKAKRLIGYAPRYSLAEGMCRVAAWAKWANMA